MCIYHIHCTAQLPGLHKQNTHLEPSHSAAGPDLELQHNNNPLSSSKLLLSNADAPGSPHCGLHVAVCCQQRQTQTVPRRWRSAPLRLLHQQHQQQPTACCSCNADRVEAVAGSSVFACESGKCAVYCIGNLLGACKATQQDRAAQHGLIAFNTLEQLHVQLSKCGMAGVYTLRSKTCTAIP